MKNKGFTKEQMEEITKLADLPDEEIDLSDVAETADWSGAEIGKFFRPVKQSVTLRLDADVLNWLKEGGKGYQTRLNDLLRSAMVRQRAMKQAKPRHSEASGKKEAVG
jgi:uncharacterized protein (DUF4415 family)